MSAEARGVIAAKLAYTLPSRSCSNMSESEDSAAEEEVVMGDSMAERDGGVTQLGGPIVSL